VKFTPETYSIPDISMQPFIDDQEIWSYLEGAKPTLEQVEAVIARSMAKPSRSIFSQIM